MTWQDELWLAAADIIADLGEPAVVDGSTIQALFHAAGSVLTINGEEMVIADPMAMVTAADAEELGIDGGASGTAIIVAGENYVVLSAVPDGNGLVALTLGAAA